MTSRTAGVVRGSTPDRVGYSTRSSVPAFGRRPSDERTGRCRSCVARRLVRGTARAEPICAGQSGLWAGRVWVMTLTLGAAAWRGTGRRSAGRTSGGSFPAVGTPSVLWGNDDPIRPGDRRSGPNEILDIRSAWCDRVRTHIAPRTGTRPALDKAISGSRRSAATAIGPAAQSSCRARGAPVPSSLRDLRCAA